VFLLRFLAFLSIMHSFCGCCKFHLVGVDNFGFLFGVECFLMALDIGIFKFVAKELLLVLRNQMLRVRVTNESVGASGSLASVITRW
jgi:hypothetical protein